MYEDRNNEQPYNNSYSYYERDQMDDWKTNRHTPKKKGGFFKSVIKAACLGVVFGLTASAVMFGANRLGISSGFGTDSNGSGDLKYSVNIVQTSSKDIGTIEAEDVSDIVEQSIPSIVSVTTKVENIRTDWFGRGYTEESEGAGSGIIISEQDGKQLYIVTNYHVIEGAKEVHVCFVDDKTASATVKGYDEDGDIAVLSVDMSQLEESTKESIAVAVLGNSDQLKAGNTAIAIGNALGYGQSVTTGVISAINREVALTDKTMQLIQTSAAINPGNSGGALLNGKGEVIGINTVKFSDTSVEGMGYAIPINVAVETAKGIIDGTIVPKTDETTAYLGITGGTIDEETAEAYNMPLGVYVSNVARNSAAHRAGLVGGCIITAFNGEALTTMEELQDMIAECMPGDQVTMTVQFMMQNGEYQEQDVTTIMGARSEMNQ